MATVRQTIPADAHSPGPTDSASSDPKGVRVSTPAASQPAAPDGIEHRFELLLQRVLANRPNEDVTLIRKAWQFCVQHHDGQLRASGEPYIIHPLEVAEVLVEMKLDATAIAAALLHDAVEDTPATSDEIAVGFGT